jgi:hypothetical protein
MRHWKGDDALAPSGIPDSRTKPWYLAPACLIAFAAPASADGVWPNILAEFSIEIEDEYVFRSSDPEMELNDAFATIESELALAFDSGTGLYAKATFEPVTDPEGDRFFEDFGLYLEELFLAYRIGEGGFRIGKFDPNFGLAEDAAPELYGDDLAGDYELEERIGVSIDVPFDALGGTHVASVTAFTADTTVLSDSLFTSRGRLRRADGGVSNTAYPESFVLSLAGEIEGTGYSLGFRRQSAGTNGNADEDGEADEDGNTDEYGGVVGLTRTVDLAGIETTLFGELAYFPHFDGGRESVRFLTVGAEADLGDFVLPAVYGLRKVEGSSADEIATVSLEYELRDGLSISAGYRFLQEEGETIHTVGLLLNYELSLR